MNYSLQRLLVVLGLIIVPFYEIILKALPFVRSVAPDSRAPKEMIALVFALSIGLLAVFQGTLKPFRNKYFLIIPVYLLLNLIIAPHVDLKINGVESGDFYFWKPFAEVLCFALMIIAVSSMEIDFESILNVMVICGGFMAGYVLLQKFGLDQFWITKPTPVGMGVMDNSSIGGSLGQKTIVASFIVMMIPLAVYLKRYWIAGLISIATIITGSAMAIISMVCMFLFLVVKINKALIAPILIIILILISGIFINKDIKHSIINRMDGRYEVWKNVLSDIKNGQFEGEKLKFSLTGVGLGRFPFIFPDKHKSDFLQAHNDPMEFAYNCGIFGEYLLLASIFVMICECFVHLSPMVFSISLSFLAIFICSLGGFPFQLGAHQFYSAILVGLLNNRKLLGGLRC